ARGFADLVTLGLSNKMPRLVATEPFGPYGRALQEGYRAEASVPISSSVSFSIATPMATWQGWDALVRTGGAAVTLDDAQTLAAQRQLAASDGLFVEASSATTVAALPELIERGVVGASDRVVLLATS